MKRFERKEEFSLFIHKSWKSCYSFNRASPLNFIHVNENPVGNEVETRCTLMGCQYHKANVRMC